MKTVNMNVDLGVLGEHEVEVEYAGGPPTKVKHIWLVLDKHPIDIYGYHDEVDEEALRKASVEEAEDRLAAASDYASAQREERLLDSLEAYD